MAAELAPLRRVAPVCPPPTKGSADVSLMSAETAKTDKIERPNHNAKETHS